MDNGWEFTVRGKIGGRENADGIAGLVGGVDGALDHDVMRQGDRLVILWGKRCSENIINCCEASLHGRRKVAGKEEAEWEAVFALSQSGGAL